MKVYLHFEETEDEGEKMTIKLSLPKTWVNGPFKQLKEVFIDNYNKKHNKSFNVEDYFLANGNKEPMPQDGVVADFIETGQDLFLCKGQDKTLKELGLVSSEDEIVKDDAIVNDEKDLPTATGINKILPKTENELRLEKEAERKEKKKSTFDSDMLFCKNFGCQKKYLEQDNNPKACLHHSKPPIFHETRKYWACCPERVAWDWESFMAIPGCTISEHSNVREGKSFLGGSDVRKQQEETLPQRIDIDNDTTIQSESVPKKKLTGLDKLSSLRKALVSIGVSGEAFDECRDKMKEEVLQNGTENAKVWDEVLIKLAGKIHAGLLSNQ